MSVIRPEMECADNLSVDIVDKKRNDFNNNYKFPSPFHEPWWMDAATNGQYDIIKIQNDGKTLVSMPIFTAKRFMFTCIGMPLYTRTLSPTFYLPPSKPFKRSQNIRNLVAELVSKFPKYDSVRIRLPPDDESVFGFSLLDFICEELFTFRVPASSDIEEVWKNCDQKTRNVIRSAGKKCSVRNGDDFSEFKKVSLLNKSSHENTNDFRVMERIFRAARDRNQATILTARNEAGVSVASAIIVWGSEYAYFWQSARNPACGIGGVNALLLWKAVEMASGMGLSFDFDSYGSTKSAKFLASFGLPPIIRTEVSRQTVPYKLFKIANGMMLDRKKAIDRSSAF